MGANPNISGSNPNTPILVGGNMQGVIDCAGDDFPAYVFCGYCKTAAGQPNENCDCACHTRNLRKNGN